MGISRDKAHKRRATGGKVKRIRMKRKFEMGRQPASTKIGDKKITRIRVRGGNYKFRALRLDHGNFSWACESVTRKTRILKVVYNSTNNELVRTNTLVKGSIIQIDSTPFKSWYLQHYNVDLSSKKSQEKKLETTKKDDKSKPKKEDKTTAKKEPKKEDKAKSSQKEPKTKDDKSKGQKESKTTAKKEDKSKSSQKEPKTKEDKSKGKKESKISKKPEEGERKDLGKRAAEKFAKRNSKRIMEPQLGDQFKTGRLYAKITSRPGQSGRCDGYILEGDELAFYLKKLNLKKKK
jgi:small subunit ribosomal protein S8e